MLDWLLGPEFRRRRLLKRAAPGPVRDYLAHPFPNRKTDYRELEYVAVDLETTGLDPRQDHILSVGLVPLRGPCIELAQAEHILVRTNRAIPEASAVIHQITDEQAAQGDAIALVIPHLLEVLGGRVMIAHHARIESGFIDAACAKLYRDHLTIPTVDTQAVALHWFQQCNIPILPKELRLHALRERYNLPRYPAHNALSDAIAAAELFLALAAYRDPGRGIPLGEFLRQ